VTITMADNGSIAQIGCKKFVVSDNDKEAQDALKQYLFGSEEEVTALSKKYDEGPGACPESDMPDDCCEPASPPEIRISEPRQ